MYLSLLLSAQHVFLKVKLSPVHTMKHMGRGSDIRLHSFLTSAPDGGDWYPSHPSHFVPKTVWKLRKREIQFAPARIRAPNHPARSLLTILTTLSGLLQVRPTYNFLNLMFIGPYIIVIVDE